MSLASTQAAIDAAIADLLADIDTAQASFFASNGYYWQGLISHDTIPADGSNVSADNLDATPTDQAVTWDTFMGADKPGSIPAAVYCHVYRKPDGSQGYRKQVLFIYDAEFYSRQTDSGNDPGSVVAWGSSPDPVAPTVLPAPTFTSIDPVEGPEAGGTEVDIVGTGFQSGVTVSIDGEACTSVVRNSATSITCDTPAGSAGSVDVVITNIDGKSVTGTDEFEYTAGSTPPAFVQYTTDSGSSSPGTLSLTLPVAPTSGNLLVACLTSNSGVAWTCPGFTQLQTGTTGKQLFYKISNGTETTVTPDDDGSAKADKRVGILAEFSGVNATPIDTSAAGTNSQSVPTLTTGVDNCLVLACGCSETGSADMQSAPTGWTLVGRATQGTSDLAAVIAYKAYTTAGSIGSNSWDAGTYSATKTFTVSVKP